MTITEFHLLKIVLLFLVLILLPISSWGYSSSKPPYDDHVLNKLSTSSTTTPNIELSKLTTTTPQQLPPKPVLCYSCDESISTLVREAFAVSSSLLSSPTAATVTKATTTSNQHHQRRKSSNDQHNTSHATTTSDCVVHYVSTSDEALDTLFDYPDDYFSAIIMDDTTSSNDDGWLFQQCVQRRLIPYRIVILSSSPSSLLPPLPPSLNKHDISEAMVEHSHAHYEHFYHYAFGADVVITKPSVNELQHVYQTLVGPSSQTRPKQQRHPLNRLKQRQETLQELCGGILTDRIRELQTTAKRLSKSFTFDHSHDNHRPQVSKKLPSSPVLRTALLSLSAAKDISSTSYISNNSNKWIKDTSMKSYVVKNHNKLSRKHQEQKHNVKRSQSSSNNDKKTIKRQESLRIVHISDTHNFHRYMDLPKGDVLIFTGDICGNYHRINQQMKHSDCGCDNRDGLIQQFDDFLRWIHSDSVFPKYDKIVLLAGNHDTYLDEQKCPDQALYKEAQSLLKDFLHQTNQRTQQERGSKKNSGPDDDGKNKVSYLMDSSVSYRGVTIYGTPVTICRVEARGRQMLSNGFERTRHQRQLCWDNIPNDCDILLTHLPPAGMPGANGNDSSCHLLTQTLYAPQYYQEHTNEDEGPPSALKGGMTISSASSSSRARVQQPVTRRKPPRLHCFGHVHSRFGVTKFGDTIFSNGSQERQLRDDIYGGGTPLIIDLPIQSPSGPSSTATATTVMKDQH